MKLRGARWAWLAVLCASAPAFFIGLEWGLPSRAADPFLFGQRKPWTGAQIVELAGDWVNDPNRGADVAMSPLVGREGFLILNGTDAARAAIVRRYRLFTYQPDEMITLRALAGMRPGKLQLDPKLYQYGGLWIYPVGALLKLGSGCGLVTLRSNVAWYLDHPEDFGRMYLVARAYSALWGLAGAAAIFAIVRRIIGRWQIAGIAAICFAWMPVIVNGAHEAKPHLGGAALMLLAILSAAKYVETGSGKCWLITGLLCGAATAMAPTAYPIFIILPLMVLLRRISRTPSLASTVFSDVRTVTLAGIIGGVTFLLFNPFLWINLIINREVLHSNLGNSAAMYHPAANSSGILNAAFLIVAGTSPFLALAGVLGIVLLGARAWSMRRASSAIESNRRAVGLLLAAPAAIVLIQFCALAAGKPGEYGRFAMLPDTFLMVEGVVMIATFVKSEPLRRFALAALLLTTMAFGGIYLRGFIRDSRETTGRLRIAGAIRAMNLGGAHALAIDAEPAPYCLPPVDLFKWRIVLVPRGFGPSQMSNVANVAIRPLDLAPDRFKAFLNTPISWADKHFEFRKERTSDTPER